MLIFPRADSPSRCAGSSTGPGAAVRVDHRCSVEQRGTVRHDARTSPSGRHRRAPSEPAADRMGNPTVSHEWPSGTPRTTARRPGAGSSATSSTRWRVCARPRTSRSSGFATPPETNYQSGPQTTGEPPWSCWLAVASGSISPTAARPRRLRQCGCDPRGGLLRRASRRSAPAGTWFGDDAHPRDGGRLGERRGRPLDGGALRHVDL